MPSIFPARKFISHSFLIFFCSQFLQTTSKWQGTAGPAEIVLHKVFLSVNFLQLSQFINCFSFVLSIVQNWVIWPISEIASGFISPSLWKVSSSSFSQLHFEPHFSQFFNYISLVLCTEMGQMATGQ